MTQSPFELRHTVMDVLLKLEPSERRALEHDLPRINNIMQQADQMICGKFDHTDAPVNSTDIPFDDFRAFVGEQTVHHSAHGPVTPEYLDWYDREFAKLFDAYRMTSQLDVSDNLQPYAAQPATYPLVEKYYYPRQSGVTTFITMYAKYMYDRENHGVWMIPTGGTIDTNDKEYMCYDSVQTRGRKSGMIQQVLLDNRTSPTAMLQSVWVNNSDAHSIHHYITHEGL